MELITKADDERLTSIINISNWNVLVKSLHTALETAERRQKHIDTNLESAERLRRQINHIVSERDAALAQLADEKQKVANLEEYMLKGVAFRDELQGQLCAVGEAHKEFVAAHEGQSIYNPIPEYKVNAHQRWWNALSGLQVALSSSSPCSHAKEAERLREENINALRTIAMIVLDQGGILTISRKAQENFDTRSELLTTIDPEEGGIIIEYRQRVGGG